MESHRSRRQFLRVTGAAAGLALVPMFLSRPAVASPEAMQEAIRRTVGPGPVTPGRVALDVPPLVENGNTVPLAVTVESPMSEADHVRAIHLFTERNPRPDVATFRLGPRAGRATVAIRLRLANTQSVVAIAELSDGSLWSASADVIVTLAACLEEA